ATWYAPDNAVLSIVGDVETPAALEAVNRYFAGIPAKGGFPAAPDSSLPPVIGEEVRRTVPDRVPLPRIFIGYRCPPFGSTGYDAVEVLATVLGGGRGSRLYKALVLDRPLLQPPDDAVLSPWPFVGGAALLVADLPPREGVDPDELEAAYHEVVAGIADGVSDDEMERARALITSDWLHHLSTVDGRADTFSQFTTLFDEPALVNEMLPRVLSVTDDDLRRVAADVIRPDNRVVLVFEPAGEPDEAAA
ncbi:MAG: hypothetical protein QOF18_3117, partial [Frankiaceae bacterium]|nr:hypothetical protein [Frankiaceae bacterium]